MELLDSYDHQTMKRPKGNAADYVLTYEECREVISDMRFGDESDLFGKEKDDSFKGSIGNNDCRITTGRDGNDDYGCDELYQVGVYPCKNTEKIRGFLIDVRRNSGGIDYATFAATFCQQKISKPK